MNFRENEKIELKEIYTSEIKKEVVAFCNTTGGIIYLGVDDNGEVIGLDNADYTAQQITNSLRDSIKPDITMFTNIELISEKDKEIIKLTINEGTRKPYYLSDKGIKSSGVYVRQGTSAAQASEDAIRNMIKISDGNSFELNRSLEQDLHFETLSKEMKLRNIDFKEVNKKNLSILNNDNIYTNLGLLVSDECKHSIKLAVFQGTDKSVFKDRKEFNGSIFKQLNEAYSTIDFYNSTKATFDNLIRIDSRDYPKEAIREALLNAIIHRDYSFSGSIIINIYSDKMEIISLGGLVSGISLEAIMAGASQPRNEKLAALFYRMELIEAYGTGISKISTAYKDCETKPTFKSVDGAFIVTLPNMNFQHNVTISNPQSNDTYNKIVSFINENEKITRKQIEKLCDIKLTRANSIVKDMLELDIIEKKGNGKSTYYVLK